MPALAAAKINPQDQISLLAYRIWEEEGRPNGRAEAHWLMAEEIVKAKTAKPAKARRTLTKSKVV